MNLYHGTTEECADELAGRPELVSVEKGGGELGRGFYMGDHIALAASWARGRYSGRMAVLEIRIDPSAYVRLSIKTLNWHQVVSTWNELRTHRQTRMFVFGWDVVHGPLATMQHATQHKFESGDAEVVLRNSIWRKLQANGDATSIPDEAWARREFSPRLAARRRRA